MSSSLLLLYNYNYQDPGTTVLLPSSRFNNNQFATVLTVISGRGRRGAVARPLMNGFVLILVRARTSSELHGNGNPVSADAPV